MKKEELIEISDDADNKAPNGKWYEYFANEVERRTLERAAAVCDELVNNENSHDYNAGAGWCATRIRALKDLK